MAVTPVLGDATAGPWFHVLALAVPDRPDSAEHDYADVLPAALSAARRGKPFAVGWLCRGPGRPLELITNAGLAGPAGAATGARPRAGREDLAAGPAPTASAAAGEPWDAARAGAPLPLLFPVGAGGAPAAPDWLAACEALVWAPCLARQVPPLAQDRAPESERDRRQPTRFEAALGILLGRPFGWLVVAEPTDLLQAEVAGLRTQVNVLRRHEEEQARFSAERAQRRLAELDSHREAGLWSVRVLAGAASPAELAVLAPVLAGAADLGRHSYRLGCAEEASTLADALAAKAQEPESGASAPFAATAGVLAALCGLPRREVPGVRVLEPARFDLTSETAGGPGRVAAEDGPAKARAGGPGPTLGLGEILDGADRPVGEFRVPLPTVNRHVFVAGATGAGKSQTVRHLLEQATRAGLPWLAIEPVKSEYAAMAGRLADAGDAGAVTVVNPADPESIPLSVNPLAPEPGYPVQAHIDLMRALFLAAFSADEPFPQVMSQALERVYQDNGWDVVTGGRAPGAATQPAVPTLAQLQRAAATVVRDVGYGRELEADVRGFVDVRLRSLRVGSAGRFFEGGHPADIGGLLRRNVVLALEDVANDEDKAFLMGTLIIRITEHLRLRARSGATRGGGLRHVLVIEEAHRLLRAARGDRPGAQAVELFAGLLAEIRAYGEGLVVAEQIPAKLIPDVIKNTALKVVHRLPARDDRDLVGAAMNLDEEQSRQVVSFPPGVAAVFADGMDRPVRVRMPFGEERERVLPGPAPPILGRRSGACGARCAGQSACTQRDIRRAELIAGSLEPDVAWLRLWAETMVLAFLVGRGLPAAPAPLRRWWRETDPRLRECALATVLERAVGGRARALRASYDPGALAACVGQAAAQILDGGAGAGRRSGPTWVVPQLRWLHEMERVCPASGSPPDPDHRAPPLDFDLPGLADWPGMRIGHRVRALRRHPLSMDLSHNQAIAWTALLGEDDHRAFAADLALAGVGLDAGAQLRHAARCLAVGSWLEVVLAWPRRLVAGRDLPDPPTGAPALGTPVRTAAQAG